MVLRRPLKCSFLQNQQLGSHANLASSQSNFKIRTSGRSARFSIRSASVVRATLALRLLEKAVIAKMGVRVSGLSPQETRRLDCVKPLGKRCGSGTSHQIVGTGWRPDLIWRKQNGAPVHRFRASQRPLHYEPQTETQLQDRDPQGRCYPPEPEVFKARQDLGGRNSRGHSPKEGRQSKVAQRDLTALPLVPRPDRSSSGLVSVVIPVSLMIWRMASSRS